MAWRSSSRNYLTGTGSLVLNKPTGTVSGDILLLAVTGFFPGYTLPSGFTQIGSDLDIGGPDGQRISVFRKVAGGSEPSTYTLTVNNGSEPTATLHAFSGRDTTSPITAYATSTNTSNNSSPITLSLTGVTAAQGDDIVLVYAGDTTQGADRWSGAPPAGYTEIEDYDPQDWAGIYAHVKENVSSGATGTLQPTLTRTAGSGGAGWLGFVIALKASATADVTVGLTGQSATGNAGTVVSANSKALTGQSATASVGNVTASLGAVTVSLIGVSSTSAVGNVVPANSKTLTGQNATATGGIVTPNTAKTLTGQAATANQGTVVPNTAKALDGQPATGSVGNVSASAGSSVTVSLAGVSATGNAGAVTPANSKSLTGQNAIASSGIVIPNTAKTLTGQSSTGNQGSVVPSMSKPLTGNSATASVGSVSVSSANVTVTLTGVSATCSVGTVKAGISKTLTGLMAIGNVGSLIAEDGQDRLRQAIKEAYASAPSGIIIIHTLEFRHPNFRDQYNQPTAIRAVLGYDDLEACLETDAPLNAGEYVTFIRMAFEFELPSVEHLAVPELSISIDNVSREIEDNLMLAAASPYPIEVTYRPYLNTDLSQPQMNPPLTMVLTSAEADDFRVTARASFGNASNVLCPRELYTADRFPGLQR